MAESRQQIATDPTQELTELDVGSAALKPASSSGRSLIEGRKGQSDIVTSTAFDRSSSDSSDSTTNKTSSRVSGVMTAREWLMLFILSLLWGGSFFFIGVAVQEIPPFTLIALRVGLGAVILGIVLLIIGKRLPKNGEAWKAFAGLALLNNILPASLIVWGMTEIASGLASILNATTPLFTVLVAHVLTRDERLTPARLVGVLIGFGGVIVVIGLDVLSSFGLTSLAQIACLGGALSYAFASIYGRRFKTMGLDPLVTATGQVLAASILMLPLALISDRPWTLPLPGWGVISAVLGLATLSTALAYILFFHILATAGATNISLVTFLIPANAILLGALFLGEQLVLNHFLGMALIGVGLLVIDGRVLQKALAKIRSSSIIKYL